jgi:hypothetical protein
MSTPPKLQVVLVGERADLAARPFEAEWGRTRIAAPGEGGENADLAIVLDPEVDAAGFAATRQVVWHPAAPGVHTAATAVSRPWPAADDLFDMLPSARDNGCLVIASETADGEGVGERLAERGLRVRVAPGATRELLAETRIVVSMTDGPPAETFGVLAAGRLLVAPAGGRTYGLQPWIDHATFSTEDDLVEVVDAFAAYPTAWAHVQGLGRQSAEPHRASKAVGRLVRRIQAGIA